MEIDYKFLDNGDYQVMMKGLSNDINILAWACLEKKEFILFHTSQDNKNILKDELIKQGLVEINDSKYIQTIVILLPLYPHKIVRAPENIEGLIAIAPSHSVDPLFMLWLNNG